jgi:hypothetical protein
MCFGVCPCGPGLFTLAGAAASHHAGLDHLPDALDGVEVGRTFRVIFQDRAASSLEGFQVPVLPQTLLVVLHEVARLAVSEAIAAPLGEARCDQVVVAVAVHVRGLVLACIIVLRTHPILQPAIGQEAPNLHCHPLALRVKRGTDVVIPEAVLAVGHLPNLLAKSSALLVTGVAWADCEKPRRAVSLGKAEKRRTMPGLDPSAEGESSFFVERWHPRLATP